MMDPVTGIICWASVEDHNLCNFICVTDHPPDNSFCKTETCIGVNMSEVSC